MLVVDIVDPAAERYMRDLLARYDEPVLLDMEAVAKRRGFPIVGRQVGVTLELLARAVSAQRMIELGSGFGYSAYWFSRAIGNRGEIHCTDGDPENERKAMDYLGRAGLAGPILYHVGEAVDTLKRVEGTFDLVYNDIDKGAYPDAWRASRDRIRPGGLYLCDNVLWSGRVALQEQEDEGAQEGWTRAIREHNSMIAGDERYLSVIVPTRDGVMAALRIT